MRLGIFLFCPPDYKFLEGPVGEYHDHICMLEIVPLATRGGGGAVRVQAWKWGGCVAEAVGKKSRGLHPDFVRNLT